MMTKTVGTLREIGARVGDVVELVKWGDRWDDHNMFACHQQYEVMDDRIDSGYGYFMKKDCGDDMVFKFVSRATRPFNTLTAEEKGALMLANHEGKIIEMSLDGGETWERSYTPQWIGAACYRVKADDVELVSLAGSKFVNHWGFGTDMAPSDTHRITFSLVNGKPDCASVKMEEIK